MGFGHAVRRTGHAAGRGIWACCREDLSMRQRGLRRAVGRTGHAAGRGTWACCRENFTVHSDWEVLMEE